MKIACIGDSLTECKALNEHQKWSYLLSGYDDIVCTNYGISGDTTVGMLSRCINTLSVASYSHCFIMGGTNDLWYGADVNSVIQNINAMLKQILYMQKVPIIGIPPYFIIPNRENDPFSDYPPIGGYDELIQKLSQYRDKLIKLCISSEVTYVDILPEVLLNPNELIANEKLFLEDGLHFNFEGSKVVAECIFNTINKKYL